MGDEFDGCECLWNHELAMRRLLSLLRQGQNYCTDTECIDLPGSPAQSSQNGTSDLMFMGFIMIFAVIIYFLRPSSMRRRITDVMTKPSQQPPPGNDPNNGAPPPPAVG